MNKKELKKAYKQKFWKEAKDWFFGFTQDGKYNLYIADVLERDDWNKIPTSTKINNFLDLMFEAGAKAERERIEKIIRHYAKLYDGKGYPLLPKWEGILEELKQKKELNK